MKNKYKNEKIIHNGIKFDSKQELDFYLFLIKQQEIGVARSIQLQPKVTIQPTFKKQGKRYLAITYSPDFLVRYVNGKEIYYDVKGMSTQAGELRRKMFIYQNDIKLVWIAASKKYSKSGFINWDVLQKIRRDNKKRKCDNES